MLAVKTHSHFFNVRPDCRFIIDVCLLYCTVCVVYHILLLYELYSTQYVTCVYRVYSPENETS